MYLYVSDKDDSELFADNSVSSFRVKLPKRLEFCRGDMWELAVLDAQFPLFQDGYVAKYLVLLCNVVDVCIFRNRLVPVLSRLYFKQVEGGVSFEVQVPRYVSVNVENLDILEFRVVDDKFGEPRFEEGGVDFSLHLRRKYLR